MGAIKELVTEGQVTIVRRMYRVVTGHSSLQEFNIEAIEKNGVIISPTFFAQNQFINWQEFEEALYKRYNTVIFEYSQTQITDYPNLQIVNKAKIFVVLEHLTLPNKGTRFYKLNSNNNQYDIEGKLAYKPVLFTDYVVEAAKACSKS